MKQLQSWAVCWEHVKLSYLSSVRIPFKCFPHCSVISFMFGWLLSICMFIYKLTQMLETCWYESLQGRAGYIIYTYCMYTIKLKALILSIVFNYLRFLMMKIDCTVFFLLFFYSLLVHVVARTGENFMDGTHQHSCHTAVQPGVKKREKGISAVVCCPSWMHRLNICNSGFALICTADIQHLMVKYFKSFFFFFPTFRKRQSGVLMYSSIHQDA